MWFQPYQVTAILPLVLVIIHSISVSYAFLSIYDTRRPAPPRMLRGYDAVWWALDNSIGEYEPKVPSSSVVNKSSHIVSIKSCNIAGLISDREDSDDIQVDFGSEACLVAITGESGTGKSLLVSKALDLVSGGKAVSSLILPPLNDESNNGQEKSSSVELTAKLYEPQLTAVLASLEQHGIDSSILYNCDTDNNEQSKEAAYLHLKRTLSTNDSGRVKSICSINGEHISLKTMRQMLAPLLVRVDVGVASAALGRPASRLAILDMGVPVNVIRNCIKLRDTYKEAKKNRKRIKHELESRVLPSSLQGLSSDNAGFNEEQMVMMEHWVDELDSFEIRINIFKEAVLEEYNQILVDEELNNDSWNSSGIANVLHNLQTATWGGNDSDDDSLFTNLLDFREEIKAVETQLITTQAAYESLASLNQPNSALVALENTRKLLFSISNDDSGPLFETIERSHELLNGVESTLSECARSIDGNSNSLLSTLEKMAFSGIPNEEVDGIIADWNSLARKHGISPYSLPICHQSIRQELDGNVEALKLLPEAEENERIALEDYTQACIDLSDARKEVASELSASVSNILPSLGLEGSTLQVELSLRPGGHDAPYSGLETVGVDMADFLLLHQKNSNDVGNNTRGGNIEQAGSSGEKSRVLLAIETALPGSIGSVCNSYSNDAESILSVSEFKTPPISIVYDEIDAHVGGRSAVTMAKLLSEQSRPRSSSDSTAKGGSQIIVITHSASLAAIADRHIVIERGISNESKSLPIRTYAADGSERRKEIARMASGDLATGEAETFAEALLRDALLQKESLSL